MNAWDARQAFNLDGSVKPCLMPARSAKSATRSLTIHRSMFVSYRMRIVRRLGDSMNDVTVWEPEDARCRQHAIDCGVDLTCAAVVAIGEGFNNRNYAGITLRHGVNDPETGGVVLHAGTVMNNYLVRWLLQWGVDYIIVDAA